ncbi:MAG: Actin-related protein 2/3 complex subunit 3 [Paramarteilia canceri]
MMKHGMPTIVDQRDSICRNSTDYSTKNTQTVAGMAILPINSNSSFLPNEAKSVQVVQNDIVDQAIQLHRFNVTNGYLEIKSPSDRTLFFLHLVIHKYLETLEKDFKSKVVTIKESENRLRAQGREIENGSPTKSSFPSRHIFVQNSLAQKDQQLIDSYCDALRDETAMRLANTIYGSKNDEIVKHWIYYSNKKFLKNTLR